jgi:hypothetical protein
MYSITQFSPSARRAELIIEDLAIKNHALQINPMLFVHFFYQAAYRPGYGAGQL